MFQLLKKNFYQFKLENTLFILICLFVFKLIFVINNNMISAFLNLSLVFIAIHFSIIFFDDYLEKKINTPINYINYILIFTIINIPIYIFYNNLIKETNNFNSFFYIIITNITFILFVLSISILLVCLKRLILLRQKTSLNKYFDLMLFFFLASSFSELLVLYSKKLEFITTIFFIISFGLIVINSIKVAWIALLPKKNKLWLLILTIPIIAIYTISFFNFKDGLESFNRIFELINPGFHNFIILFILFFMVYSIIIFFTTLFHLPTAEVIDKKSKELSSLIDLNKLLTQVFDVKELANSITETTTKVCSADACWLYEFNEDKFTLLSIKNIGYYEAEKISELFFNNKEIDKVLLFTERDIKKTNQEVFYSDYNNFIIATLKIKEKFKGYLFAAKKGTNVFDEDEQRTILTYADYAALTLEHAQLIKNSLEKERMEKELDLAREIQNKIIPIKLPKIKQLEISAQFIPAFEVGGDYYDFFELSDEKLAFVIADVSGKGISAAFIMAEIKGIFASLATIILNPRDIFIAVNKILKNSLSKKSFISAIYGIFDIKNASLSFARTGHPPLFLIRDNNIFKVKPNGIGLGLDYSGTFDYYLKEEVINLINGDIIILITDGITESKNKKLEDFGEDNFEQVLKENYKKGVEELSRIILEKISCYSMEQPQHDDITLVIFKWNNNTLGENK